MCFSTIIVFLNVMYQLSQLTEICTWDPIETYANNECFGLLCMLIYQVKQLQV